MEFVGWWRENDKRHGKQALRESKCERVAMVSAGVGMCGGLRRRALTFHSGAGSEICIQSEERAEAGRSCMGPSTSRCPKWKAIRPR